MPSAIPTIASLEMLDLQGVMDPFGTSVSVISPPMADGAEFRVEGIKSVPYQLESLVDLETAEEVKDQIDAYKALQGTLVTVADALGNSRETQMVLQVTPIMQKKVPSVVGGINVDLAAPGYLLACRWLMQAGEPTPEPEPEP